MEAMMNLEQRVDRLEAFAEEVKQRLARIEARLDVIESRLEHMATKADLAALETRMLKWFVGTAITMSTVTGTLAFAAAKFIH
jgi:predicted  nucleic acid-binding Zn-ribbon protein